jgi:sulfatase modifying factor 1
MRSENKKLFILASLAICAFAATFGVVKLLHQLQASAVPQKPATPVAEPPYNPHGAPQPSGERPQGMVWIPGGEFTMGCEDPRSCPCGGPDAMADARPLHRVYVDGFWMDQTELTNEQFADFVKATGYVTIAERTPTKGEFPTAPPENLVAGSTVYTPTDGPVKLDNHFRWWRYVKGANWRHPHGPDSNISGKQKFPVVHIAYGDAVAYCNWAGKRMPTEAEWEFAARGGLDAKRYTWGDDLKPDDKWMANIYQGKFPVKGGDTGEDGFVGIAPVSQFPANGYGLHDMAGNVWEWCSDWYRPDYYATLAKAGSVARNPKGPDSPFDPAEPTEKKRVHRGGSFLCSDQYCTRYLVGSRGKGEVNTGSNHVGFRCVKSPEAPPPKN